MAPPPSALNDESTSEEAVPQSETLVNVNTFTNEHSKSPELNSESNLSELCANTEESSDSRGNNDSIIDSNTPLCEDKTVPLSPVSTHKHVSDSEEDSDSNELIIDETISTNVVNSSVKH